MADNAPQAAAGFPALSMAEANGRLSAPGSPFELAQVRIRGLDLRAYKHAPPSLREVFLAGAAHDPKTFLVLDDERIAYAAHRKLALAIAAQLLRDGLKKGDRVALLMRNLPEWPAIFWGAALAGAIVTPLNGWWTGPELEYGLADSAARFLFADGERWARIAPADALPALEKIYLTRAPDAAPDGRRLVSFEAAFGPPAAWAGLPERAAPEIALAPDDDVTIFYTSGTTGKPKGAIGSHRGIITNLLNIQFAAARAALRAGEAAPVADPAAPQRALLLTVPFFHVTGCFAIMLACYATGAKIVLQRKWDVDSALALIERERINQFGGVPTMAWQVIEHPRAGEFDLSSVDTVSYGGAPSSPELVKKVRARFANGRAAQGWGMTETCGVAASNSGPDYEARPWSCGPVTPVADAKIVGAGGAAAAPGEVGELWYRSPGVVRGYWNKPEASAETFVEGWVKTGDLATIDADGFIAIVDRAKDMLIRGGENIYCVEVENALYEHPAVLDAAVIGIPHRTLGEEPGAIVHLKKGAQASEEELRAFVRARLAAFKTPVRVHFSPEILPRNANGKILKRELKGVFADRA